jgi:hypothetical protein
MDFTDSKCTGGRDEKCIQNFWRENMKKRNHLQRVGRDCRIILNRMSGCGLGSPETGK